MVSKTNRSIVPTLAVIVALVLLAGAGSFREFFKDNQDIGIQRPTPSAQPKTNTDKPPRIIHLRAKLAPDVKDKEIIYTIDGETYIGDRYPGDNPWETEFVAYSGQVITFSVSRKGKSGLMICWIRQDTKLADMEIIHDPRACNLRHVVT